MKRLTDKDKLIERLEKCYKEQANIGQTPSWNAAVSIVVSAEEEQDTITAIIQEQQDTVNHPSHYETGKFECIDVMIETQGREAVQAFCLCNAFKYLYRHKRKNGAEDIEKALWYLSKYIEIQDEEGAAVEGRTQGMMQEVAHQEITRCKECKHSKHWYRDRRRCFLWAEDGIDVFDDGFCNYAERKTDE